MSTTRKKKVRRARVTKQERVDRIGEVETILGQVGVRVQIYWEDIERTEFFRLFVVAPKFQFISYSDRQSLVWRAAEHAREDDLRRVTTIMTLTPRENDEW